MSDAGVAAPDRFVRERRSALSPLRGAVRDAVKGWLARRSAPRSAELGRKRLVIVGNGMVGQRLCERLVERRARERYEIVILSEEKLPAYDRVHLSELFRGREATGLVFRERDWYGEHGIELRLDERVASLDRSERVVRTEAGGVYAYDALVFATGSRATLPRVPVAEGAELIAYRTIEDAERVLTSVRGSHERRAPVVVIGGGLLGVEAARSFQLLGCEVSVLEASSQLMPRQLDPAASEHLLGTLTGAGLTVRLRSRIERVELGARGPVVVLDGGERIEAGAVVAAAGAQPSDDVARAAGLRCHARGGIEVDQHLRSSDPHVFAVGECASHRDVPHGLVAPGYAMADVLAAQLMGGRGKLGPQAAVTRLKLDLTEVTVLGDPVRASSDQDLCFTSAGVYRRLVVFEGRVVAAIVIGAWSELAALQTLVASGKRIPAAALRRFPEHGELGLQRARTALKLLPASAVVCQCANVTHGTLKAALAAGACDVAALSRATGAGSLCGSCRPALAELCGAPAEAESRPRVLLTAAASALALAGATLLSPNFPVAKSVREQGIDRLFVDPLLKQVSGYAIVATLLVGLMFSLRKRVARFRFSSYARLRVWHGVLGALAVAGLFLHTGFRLGSNLNLALMLCFLVSVTTGGLAAVFASASNARSRAVARVLRRTHEITFWPLPVLIGFHALKSYYY